MGAAHSRWWPVTRHQWTHPAIAGPIPLPAEGELPTFLTAAATQPIQSIGHMPIELQDLTPAVSAGLEVSTSSRNQAAEG